jgi:formylmethanofuran dehydrogenase subunit E
MSDRSELRCPICGVGVVADIAYDRDPGAATPKQSAEADELTTYSCGHQVLGRSLASADAEVLDVERRRSEDTVQPT